MKPIKTLLLLITFVVACQSCSPIPAVAITPLPQVDLSETTVAPVVLLSNTRPAENTPFPTHTAPRPTSTRETTLPPSATPTATTKPTNTPPVEISPGSFTTRKPAITDVTANVAQAFGPVLWTDPNAELIYQDVNGDGSDDLIYNNAMEVAILLWRQDSYHPAYHTYEGCGHYSCSSRLLLEDWTGDDVPEVVFDWYHQGGGSNLLDTDWNKTIVSCQAQECRQVWSGQMDRLWQDTYFMGLSLDRVNLKQVVAASGIRLVVETSGYQLASVGIGEVSDRPLDEEIRNTRLFTETITTYEWNGELFELKSEEEVAPEEWIESQPVLEQKNSRGDVATIQFEREAIPRDDGTCTIWINQKRIPGESFSCKEPFTTIAWQDLTADGQPELLARTMSSDFYFMDRDCVYERLLVYSWDGQSAGSLADVYGCVVEPRPDAFGVRIVNDGQGPATIQAANESLLTEEQCLWSEDFPTTLRHCWVELAPLQIKTYVWNGSQFIKK